MTKLEKIEQSILDLSAEELRAFAEWFESIRERNLDDAIEQDARDGRLNALADKAFAEFGSGHTKTL